MSKKQNVLKIVIILLLVLSLLVSAFLIGNIAGKMTGKHNASSNDRPPQSSNGEEISVSDGIFDLIAAWNSFMQSDVQQTDLEIELNFGALGVDEEFVIKTGVVDDIQVTHIQRGKLDIYVCDGKVFVEDDNAHLDIHTGEYEDISMRRVFAVAYEICTKGDFDIRQSGDETVYSLTLTQQQIEDIVYSLQGTMQDINVKLDKGELILVTENGELEKMGLLCTGYTEILSAKVEGSLKIEAELATPSQPIVLPPAVAEQIK